MRNRVLLAASTLALVPTLLLAQQRPAQQPAQRPAAQPAARPMAAQYAGPRRDGSWELTAGVGVMGVGAAFVGSTTFMPGGTLRVGYNLNEMWNISVGTGLGYGKSSIPNVNTAYLTPGAAVTWTPDINKTTSPFLLAGAGLIYQKNPSNSAFGVQVGAGVRHMIGDALALRVEGGVAVASYKSTTTGAGTATVGLSYFVGGGPLKDSDGDGVPDKYDRCPDTPRGAIVDARGCPIDSDHDGVPDGIDRCPNTPSGVHVDAMGCPVDSDHDGVPDYQDRCANTPAGVHVDATGCPVDSDGDGVPDYQDRCPNTPHGAPVDANGCPRDTDGDGVADYLDRCPDTPHGATVDANGCPVDSDHDGVPDYKDKCPNTAPGTQVDADGCPVERDSDGDGVIDSNDKCPNTPHGVAVYKEGPYAGCAVIPLPAGEADQMVLRVQFVTNRASLVPASTAILDTIAVAILASPGSRWEVQGFTDIRGTVRANQILSQARAQSVVNYLVSRGVPRASMTATGFASQRAVGRNTTVAGQAANRRVQLRRLPAPNPVRLP